MPKYIYTDEETPIFPTKYYVATETGYVENLSSISTIAPSVNAALLLGNSYILSTIALLPDNITRIYHCDSDEYILDYAQNLIQIANNSKDYPEFTHKVSALLEDPYSFVADRIHHYYQGDKNRFIAERILSEAHFHAYKNKPNKISIHCVAIDVFNKDHVSQFIKQIKKNYDRIGLFSISNIMQFDKNNCLYEHFFNPLSEQEVSIPDATVLFSRYTPPQNGEEPRPQSYYFKGPQNLANISVFYKHLNHLKIKITNLNQRGYFTQATLLTELHKRLHTLSQNTSDISLFAKEAMKDISVTQNRPELQSHRGCKGILANLVNTLLHLCSFGLLYCTTGKFLLFSPPTHTVSTLREFSDSLSDVGSKMG